MQLTAGGFYSEHSGGVYGELAFHGVYGFFWTATEDPDNSGFIFYRKIAYNSTQVFRASTMKTNWLNVRCCRMSVRDIRYEIDFGGMKIPNRIP